MTLPRTAAEVLSGHVTLEVRCIDRVMLTFRQPRLQYGQGIHNFFCQHRGNRFASSALMLPMTARFTADIRHYIDTRRLDLVRFAKGQSRLFGDYLHAEHGDLDYSHRSRHRCCGSRLGRVRLRPVIIFRRARGHLSPGTQQAALSPGLAPVLADLGQGRINLVTSKPIRRLMLRFTGDGAGWAAASGATAFAALFGQLRHLRNWPPGLIPEFADWIRRDIGRPTPTARQPQ
jgi:hypothetical protein